MIHMYASSVIITMAWIMFQPFGEIPFAFRKPPFAKLMIFLYVLVLNQCQMSTASNNRAPLAPTILPIVRVNRGNDRPCSFYVRIRVSFDQNTHRTRGVFCGGKHFFTGNAVDKNEGSCLDWRSPRCAVMRECGKN